MQEREREREREGERVRQREYLLYGETKQIVDSSAIVVTSEYDTYLHATCLNVISDTQSMIVAYCSIIEAPTFNTGAHEFVHADAAMQRVHVSTLGTGNHVQCTLVRVGDRVGTADRVVVCWA